MTIPLVGSNHIGVDVERIQLSEYRRQWSSIYVGSEEKKRIHRRTEIDPNSVVEGTDVVVDLHQSAPLSSGKKCDPKLARHFQVFVPLRVLLLTRSRVGSIVLK